MGMKQRSLSQQNEWLRKSVNINGDQGMVLRQSKNPAFSEPEKELEAVCRESREYTIK